MDRGLALTEFTTSQLYRNFIGERGDLTAVQVTLEPNKEVERLGDLRDSATSGRPCITRRGDELAVVESAYDQATRSVNAERAALVASVGLWQRPIEAKSNSSVVCP